MAESVVNLVGKGGGSGMTLLWSNPSPNNSFSGQDVNLSSNDYSALIIAFTINVGFSGKMDSSVVALKGRSPFLFAILNNTAAGIYKRSLTRVSDTKYTFDDGRTGDNTVNNDLCVPLAIYGIK